MSNPIIKIVRDFIKTCPHLPEYYKGIGVNYLSDQTDTYVIESVPAEEIIDGYTDGSTTRQFVFLFASKEPYGEDVLSNIDNLGFYEKFSRWFEEKTMFRQLPELGEGRVAEKLTAESVPYVFSEKNNKARYQVQCRLVYYQPRIKENNSEKGV